MSNENVVYSVQSLSFCQLLTVAFIVLKLTGVIAWSWWWVLAPLWGPLAVVLAIILTVLAFVGIAALVTCVSALLFRRAK